MTDKITYHNTHNAEGTDQGSETDYMSVPAGPGRDTGGGEKGARLPPGPASYKARYSIRSRSESASSDTSISSSASTAVMAERRSRREAAQEANRLAVQLEKKQGGGSPLISVDSEESDGEYYPEKKRYPPRKRKLPEGCYVEEEEEDPKRKVGRPQTTGLYVGRAEAQEKLNQLKREAAELDNEKMIKNMSSGQIFAKMERDLEDAVDELSDAPTADVASQARECMAGVLKVAKCSKNLQGVMRKILNHAAVKGAASTEVLRTRADSSGSDNETARQLKELKKELEQTRREAQSAKKEAARANKEAERLRKELAELKAEGESSRRGRVFVEDSSPSPPLSPKRGQVDSVNSGAGQAEPAGAPATQVEESPMEVEIEAEEAVQEEPPKYSDERRKKEILPPPEEWPAAIRPALQGKVKILEDRPLIGHKVRLADERMTKRAETSPAAKGTKEEKGGAQLLLEQLTPLLQKWLEENLRSRGLSKRPDGGEETTAKARRQTGNGPKSSQKVEKPVRPQAGGTDGAKGKVVQSTAVPNAALWSKVVGGKTGKGTPPLSQAERQQPRDKSRAVESLDAKDPGAWRTVAKNRKAKKTVPQKTVTTAKRREAGSPSDGKLPTRGGKRKNAVAPPSQGTGSNNKAPKRRPPRTAAVVLTCPPEGYAEAMRVAQGAINLQELGIKELRPKRAATGAIVLEVPGPNGAERASVLKDKMEEALKGMEGVRVARPVKTADMRIKDLLASTSTEDVKGAVSSVGGCALHEIRMGEIRVAPNGLGTLWVQCPLGAANKVVAAGRLQIGWTSSRIEILEPRRLQCFRCLERGHVQNACPNSTDRSKLCYRCSGEGHAAKFCANDPHCVLCEGLGLASGHRVGGKACKAPKRNPRFPKAATTASEDRMEVEATPQKRDPRPCTAG